MSSIMAGYSNGIDMNKLDLRLADINGGLYDGEPSESLAGSPLNSCVYMYGRSGYGYMQYVQDSGSAAVIGSVPCRLDLETLCEDLGHRKKEITSNKVTPAQVLARRQAQNRASQQAFRNRKAKQRKELEEGFAKLQEEHSNLTQSYKTLQLEYSALKRELDSLRRENTRYKSSLPSRNYATSMRGWDKGNDFGFTAI